jgi:hypothetical protein
MLTKEEKIWLEKFKPAVDEGWEILSRWEKIFCEDVLEKFRIQGQTLNLTRKQWDVISNVSEKVGL